MNRAEKAFERLTIQREAYQDMAENGGSLSPPDYESFIDGFNAAEAESRAQLEQYENLLIMADKMAQYVSAQGSSGHNWPTTAEAQRTYVTARLAARTPRGEKNG